MFQMKKATRKASKMRVGFFGPSGSGKTYSALRFARGLVGDWDKIAVIDSEQGSADLYSHLGEYYTIQIEKDFSPDRYIQAIRYLENQKNIECIIVDSITHEWEGPGGCLDMHQKLGGRFDHWAKVTPKHNAFIQAILQSRCHMILTGRVKIDYDTSGKDEKTGKMKPVKVGTKVSSKEGLDYEMTLAFRVDHEHLAHVDKDRTDLFRDSIPFIISEETGEKVKVWNESGAAVTPPEQKSPQINQGQARPPQEAPQSDLFKQIMRQIMDMTDGFKDKKTLDEIISVYGKSEVIRGYAPDIQQSILENLKLGAWREELPMPQA